MLHACPFEFPAILGGREEEDASATSEHGHKNHRGQATQAARASGYSNLSDAPNTYPRYLDRTRTLSPATAACIA
ncbi:hypothetical protein ACLOJK_008591 [Asimina triloba]